MTIFVLATFALKSSLILAVAGLATLVFRKMGASYRHLIWTAGFCAILALPVLQLTVPARTVAVLPAAAQPATEAPSAPIAANLVSPVASVTAPPSRAQASSSPGGSQAFSVGKIVLAAWEFGLATCLGLQAVSLFVLGRFANQTRSAAVRNDLLSRAGVNRTCDLLVTGSGPKTWGVFRPSIALPAACSNWPAEQLDAVVLHELIHVRRLDFLTQTLATAACALNWFNPLAWLCLRFMKIEAERATDECVLMSGAKPSVYAEALLQAALESRTRRRFFASAGVPLMKRSSIESRVRAILNPRGAHRPVTSMGAMATVAASLLLVLPCAAIQAGSKDAAANAHQDAAQQHARRQMSADARQNKQFRNHLQVAEETIRRLEAKVLRQQKMLQDMKYSLVERQAKMANRDRMLSQGQQAKVLQQLAELQTQAEISRINAEKNAIEAQAAVMKDLERKRALGVISSEDMDRAHAEIAERKADMAAAMTDMQKLKMAAGAEAQARREQSNDFEKRALDKALRARSRDLRAGGNQAEAARKAEYTKIRQAYEDAYAQYKKAAALQKQGAISADELQSKKAAADTLKAMRDELVQRSKG